MVDLLPHETEWTLPQQLYIRHETEHKTLILNFIIAHPYFVLGKFRKVKASFIEFYRI